LHPASSFIQSDPRGAGKTLSGKPETRLHFGRAHDIAVVHAFGGPGLADAVECPDGGDPQPRSAQIPGSQSETAGDRFSLSECRDKLPAFGCRDDIWIRTRENPG